MNLSPETGLGDQGGWQELIYGQPWQETTEPGFNPGRVRLRRRGGVLELEAHLVDNAINDPPAQFNEEAFRRGDVFELFIQAEGDAHYHEFHVTPSNVLLQLRFEIGQPRDLAKAKIWEARLTSTVERFGDGWSVRCQIPLGGLTGQRPLPTLWKIACGRYDYATNAAGERQLRISNTAPLSLPQFHRREEWPVLNLGNG